MQHIERGIDFGTECLHANGATLNGMKPFGLDPIPAGQELTGPILELPPIRVYSTPPEPIVIEPQVTEKAKPRRRRLNPEEENRLKSALIDLEVETEIFAAGQAMVSAEIAMSVETPNAQRGLETPRDVDEDPFWEEAGPGVTYEQARRTRIRKPTRD